MSTKLSKKQREFLQVVEAANTPYRHSLKELPISDPHYIGHGFAYDWGFRSESDAARWLENLEARRLIRIEKRHFVRITDAGRAALDPDHAHR